MTTSEGQPVPNGAAPEQGRAGEQRRARWLVRGWPLALGAALALAVVAAGAVRGTAVAILVLAAAALLLAIGAFWSSLRSLFALSPMSAQDAYELAAPRTEDERKRAVLRAIKDLDFERSVGKVGEQDYQRWLTRLRAVAKRLLEPLGDAAGPARDEAERMVADHLRRRRAVTDPAEAPPSSDERLSPEDGSKRGRSRRRRARAADRWASPLTSCPKCETPNDPDAVYCKKCGRRIAPEPAADDRTPS